ncbi:MAG TPA: hypothetical protein DCZ94_11055 [Lentisphaeria bacterium]|nr:MAG: hypothetical protein A2X48_06935 [Lentisphaerae bacterium GWF2_49_21]HBC87483.1 hypothetical protein [Lentisphaeria bacterium]
MKSRKKKLKVFWIGFFLLITLSSGLQGQDMSIQRAIEDLGAVEPDRQKSAVEFISSKGVDVLPELLAYFYPDMEQAIADLGHDDFIVRKKATDLLKQRGRICADKIRKRFEESKDPEVRERCREILSSFKDKVSDGHPSLFNAYKIVFRDGIPVEKALPFYEEFFGSFSLLPSGKDVLLRSALKQLGTEAKYLPLLRKALPEIKDKESFELIANALFVADPSSVPEILKRIEEGNFSVDELETRLLRTKEARNIVLERVKKNSSINSPFANSLWNIPNFEEIYKDDAKVFLGSPRPDVQGMGLRLIREDPEPYIDTIMGTVRKSQEKGSQGGNYFHFFRVLEKVSRKEIFLPYLDEFLKSKDPAALKFAVDVTGKDLALYMDKFLKAMPQDNEYYTGQIIKSILEKNPGKSDVVKKYLVELLKKCSHRDMDKIVSLSKTLKEKIKCDDVDFDAWWKKIAEDLAAEVEIKDRQWKTRKLLQAADNLNIKPEIIFPHLDMACLGYGNHLPEKFMKSGLKGEFLEKMLEALKNPIEHDYSEDLFFKDVLREAPDFYPAILNAYMGGLKKSSAADMERICQHGNGNIIKLGNFLYGNPQHRSLLLPYLKDNSEKIRFVAAWILGLGGSQDAILHKTLFELGKTSQGKSVRKKLLHMMFLSECNVEGINDLAAEILLEQEGGHDLEEILNGLPIADRNYLPLLKKVLMKLKDGSRHKDACIVARYVLEADLEDKEANEYLCELVLKDPDVKYSDEALRALRDFGRIPEIPAERWEYLYKKSAYPATFNDFVNTRPENLKNALPVIIRNLNLFAGAYNPLGNILWKKSEAQKMLVPVLLELAGSNDMKMRKMAFEELCGCEDELARHIDLLPRFLEKEKGDDCLKSLLWAIAKVGLPASGMVPLIERRMEDPSYSEYCIFALSRISPEKEKRLQYVKSLISKVEDNGEEKWRFVRMLGRVKEFEDVIEPELNRVLFADEGKCSYAHDQVIYGMVKTPYSEKTIETFRKILERNTGRPPDETESCLSALFWCFDDQLEEGVKFLPLLEKLHFRKLRESRTRGTIVRLRRFGSK